jgi:hypothetical protein
MRLKTSPWLHRCWLQALTNLAVTPFLGETNTSFNFPLVANSPKAYQFFSDVVLSMRQFLTGILSFTLHSIDHTGESPTQDFLTECWTILTAPTKSLHTAQDSLPACWLTLTALPLLPPCPLCSPVHYPHKASLNLSLTTQVFPLSLSFLILCTNPIPNHPLKNPKKIMSANLQYYFFHHISYFWLITLEQNSFPKNLLGQLS